MRMSQKPFLRSISLPVIDLQPPFGCVGKSRRNGSSNIFEGLGLRDMRRLQKLGTVNVFSNMAANNERDAVTDDTCVINAVENIKVDDDEVSVTEDRKFTRRIGLADIFKGVNSDDLLKLFAEYSCVDSDYESSNNNNSDNTNNNNNSTNTNNQATIISNCDREATDADGSDRTPVMTTSASTSCSKRKRTGLKRSVSIDCERRPCGYGRRNGLANVLEHISQKEHTQLVRQQYSWLAI